MITLEELYQESKKFNSKSLSVDDRFENLLDSLRYKIDDHKIISDLECLFAELGEQEFHNGEEHGAKQLNDSMLENLDHQIDKIQIVIDDKLDEIKKKYKLESTNDKIYFNQLSTSINNAMIENLNEDCLC